MELALATLGSLWLMVVPGLPLGAALASRRWIWWEVLAVTPILSLGLNYALLETINHLGIEPDLRIYGLLLTAATAVATWKLIATGRVRADIRPHGAVALLLLPAAVALMVWAAAYSGFELVAPNQDAYNHNLWISRVMSEGSVLSQDVLVASPLQPQAAGGSGFYPLAWHANAAVGASLFGVAAPTMSIVSAFLFWCMALPAGLVALARRITRHGVLIGIVAGMIAQTVPLVPGVPMSWGAMPAVIGVALLPAAFLSVISFFDMPSLSSLSLLGLVGISLFFIHSPEAATLLVIFLACVVVLTALRRRFDRVTALTVGGLGALAVIGLAALLTVFRGAWDTVSQLLGSNERTINETIGSFVTLSINVPNNQLVFGLLVLVGLWLAATMTEGPWLAVAVISIFGVYLVSGANTEPLVRLRRLTVPWYGSYERTAWVAVPFLVLLAALPICALILRAGGRGVVRSVTIGLAALLFVCQGWQGGFATLTQLRRGVAENQIAGPGSREVFDQAEKLTKNNGVILSQAGDGSAYAYMYDGVRVTNGPYDRNGNQNADLAMVLGALHTLCAIPSASVLLQRYHVDGFLLGTRQYGGGPPPWTEAEIRQLKGTKLVSRSADLFLLTPDLGTC